MSHTDLDTDPYAEDENYLADLELPEVDERMRDKLEAFAQRVHETNQHTNLTGAKDLETIWNRHILDSLYLVPLLEGNEKHLDIGSGGGFPALPLAIACPELAVTMVESTGKKVRFLDSCIADIPCPNAEAIQERAETLGQSKAHRGSYEVVTARAVTSLAALIELSLPCLKVGGRLLAMKGRKAEDEIIAAENALDRLKGEITGFHRYWDSEGSEACVIKITKMHPTPRKYPRAVGVPSKTPL